MLVQDKIIIELKIEQLQRSHNKQMLSHLKLTDKKLGFLLNFGALF